MFISTKKFSLWNTEVKNHHSVHKIKKVSSLDKRVKPYDRLKFSHDRVDVNLFDFVVTEK
jgi:hypothetical protein